MSIFRLFLWVMVGLVPCCVEALQLSEFSVSEDLKLGEKKRIQIRLFNDHDIEEHVLLNLVDYRCNSEGQHFFGDHPEPSLRSNLSWVQLGEPRLKLAPHEARDVYYVIEVPDDVSLKGSYWSVLLIEPVEILQPQEPEDGKVKLNVKIRYAHHIVTNIGEGAPQIKVLKKEIKEVEGKRYLNIHVVNEGNLYFNPSVIIKLYDKKGLLKKTLTTAPERLYPGNPQSFLLNIEDLTEQQLSEELSGFILFDGKNEHLFGDRFTYP